MEPTKDLAQQTHDVLNSFTKYLPSPKLETVLVVGGADTNTLVKQIGKGVDIVTASPGKLIDFVRSGTLDLSMIRFFVLDEADKLIDDNAAIIYELYDKIPKTRQLQVRNT